ncbi:MAG: hypothetical protein HZA11_13510 [Nitrospirae bacterium]|nr:hypothetical protein [Nitrospirota bacterium]
MKRVVITGIGAVSPLGNSFEASWEAAKKGVSGIAPVTRFDASGIKWKVAGELKGFDASQYLSQKEISHLDPFVRYAVAASVMAVEDAKLVQKSEVSLLRRLAGARSQKSELTDLLTCSLESAAVIIGSSRGGISTIENGLNRSNRSNRRLSPYLMPSTSIGMAASYVAQK